MIDTKVKVNGKTVGEYDLINEPCVKKINGEGPDDNGNVEVASDFELPEGVPYKKSYAVKRSDYTGEKITAGRYSYVSPLTPTLDELSANGKIRYNSVTDGTVDTDVKFCTVREGTNSYRINVHIAIAFVDNAVLDDSTVLPKAGMYFGDDLNVPGYGTQELSWSIINKLSQDLLPDDYAVIKSSTSGSSKKFKITVDDSGTISATEITE